MQINIENHSDTTDRALKVGEMVDGEIAHVWVVKPGHGQVIEIADENGLMIEALSDSEQQLIEEVPDEPPALAS